MAKTKISEFSATAADNTDITNINIAEGCSPANVNNAIRSLMSVLKNQQDGSSGDPFTVAGTLNVTGAFQLDGTAGASGQVLLSAGGSNTPTWGNAFVAGMIMMWSGTIATIPSGWLLCDGSNSTPDLRNRFVVGAGSTYAVNATGGSADAIVVSHTHTGTTNTEPNHQHEVFGFWHWVDESIEIMATRLKSTDQSASGRDDDQTSGAAGGHNHSLTINSTGSSGTNANLPPYYALAFIMKS
jgi:microcystin-dependent protein